MMKLKLTPLSLLCTTLILKAEKPPNILLIMADDLGWYDVHFNGNEHLDTPNLDRFVKQGMVFPHGYAAAPVCTPTRAAMMTGMSPARLAITNHAPGFKNGMVPEGRKQAGAEKLTYLPLEAETLAERLKKEAGYATGFVGKWHLSHRKGENEAGEKYEHGLRPKSQGFDLNIGGYDRGGPPTYFAPYKIPTLKEGPEGEYLPDRLATECIDFIEKQKEGPFFLTFWNYSVHYPIEA
ncbi:MAG: sulfatase-like hydrolase/transferase, partial [Akkermansiaceae bacterium]|nr:sulfatase-like hydrolase/transferase [Akkermansiaceae bacterium]MDG1362518.1 sulfatase-like hydrolase/transferase [Akkermansiaceae bacterium]